MSVKEVYLQGNPPWGFRMNGGADTGHPLRISRVNPGSKAEAKGVREGDLITSINGQSTKCLTNSESHALLRTVKENLLLGLNEEKNASPRRRSREIKSASIISQEKDRSESPAQPKGNYKPSASQKRHQRRTRLKRRIKEILGFKIKEKKEPEDEGWVIVDAALNSQDAHSVSELNTDEENGCNAAREKEDTLTNDSEEIYDNFDFKKNRDSSQSPTSNTTTPLIMRKDKNQPDCIETVEIVEEKITITGNINDNKFDSSESLPDYKNVNYSPSATVRNSQFHDNKVSFNVLEKEKYFEEPKELWLLRSDDTKEARICEDEELSETLKILPPNDMVEVCNATIMIQDERLEDELHVPLVAPEDDKIETARSSRNPNPDYEPIEVNSSIIYPPYSSTLNYYFPQRRFLEAISEENSDLSESNEEKQDKSDKPWENSELIKQANCIGAIPNDWFDSDEGIDTSWRDGKSIEEVSDVAIVSDSFSDSDLISEDLKITRGVGDDGIIKYNVNKSNLNESSSSQHDNKNIKVLGKPPIQTSLSNKIETKIQNEQFDKILHLNKGTGQRKVDDKLSKHVVVNKEQSHNVLEKKSPPSGSKVTCRIIKQDEIISRGSSKSISDKTKITITPDKQTKPTSVINKVEKQVPDSKREPINTSTLSCKIIEQAGKQTISQKVNEKSVKIQSTSSSANSSPNVAKKLILGDTNKTKSPPQEKKYLKTTPSSGVLKNVVFSYYNGLNELKNTEKHKKIEKVNEKEKIEKETPQKKNEVHENEMPKTSGTSSIELSKDEIKPCSEKDIELVYIDSSDSDAFSNMSNVSTSNRTSSIFEKEEPGILDENVPIKENPLQNFDDNRNLIIKKEMVNINQSVKEISDICCSTSMEMLNNQTTDKKNKLFKFKESMLPNLLSPILNRKATSKPHLTKRRFSYPMSEHDLLKKCGEISCFNCSTTLTSTSTKTEINEISSSTSNKVLTPIVPRKELKTNKDSPVATRKLSLRSLPSTPSPNNLSFSSSKYENQSIESIALEFSDGSVSSESYTLPDIAQDNDLSDVSTDTIKYFHIPGSPKIVHRNPLVATEIVDLHKKFVERRGYHEASPVLKRKNDKGIEKTPEPDIIALSKCKERTEQSYTPELLAEAANLLALHKYHEIRQRKMKSDKKDESNSCTSKINTVENHSETSVVENKHEGNKKEGKKLTDPPTEIGMNETISEYKQVNKSVTIENETVGKSRLLELFQKLDSKSSTTECTTESEPFPYWLILGDNADLEDVNEFSQKSVYSAESVERNRPEKFNSDDLKQECSESELSRTAVSKSDYYINDSLIVLKSLPPGEIFNRKMYEEYLGKMAELAERRNMKIIKVSTIPGAVSLPSESQPLESEFMNKVKERNEKLGIVVDEDESDDKTANAKANNKDELPKHLKELMEITEECGDIVGKEGLLVEIDEALSPERKGFLTAKGVWSPAQTPETERKKFDFSNELKEEKEREKQKEEEEKKEPQPAVWTPRSAGASPTVERKFRSVNFQSPTPTRKEFKTSNETQDTPELPKELPIETEKDSKSRLIYSSSENSTLSPSLRLPAAQNPTITLLQKAREGHIPRGAQYLEEQPAVGPDEIIYSVKKEHVSEDHSKKIVELGPRKIEGIGPTTKEGIPIVLRSEVKEDNQQRWYKRMYDSLHKADFDKDFVTVKYKTRRGQYPYSSYSGGYSSEPERIGYDSDTSLSKYATLDRRKIRNKENDFTTSTMPRNRYGQGVNYAVNVYKNQPGRIEDYEPGNSSIAEKETKKWWDEVMDIFDGELNESKSNHYPSKTSGKPFTYSLKDAGYESDSTLVFRRRENNMSGQLLSPTEQKMAYKVIQKGGEVPFQGLRKAAPERPKEDSEIEYFPLSPTLTRIRVHKRSPKEKVYYPVSTDISYPAVKRTSRSVVPSPPRRESSKYNPTLKMFTQSGTSSPERKVDYYQDRLVTRLSKSGNIDAKDEKPHGKIKTSSSLVKYEQPKPQYGAIRQKKELLRKSPDLKAPGEVKKAMKETKVLPGTVVKSSTTLYSSARNKKPKEDKALKVTVAISTKGKEILSPTSTSSKSDTRKSPILSKPTTRLKADSPPVSRGTRPSSRSSVASTTISDHQKKITKKEIIVDPKKKKEKKSEAITKVIDKNKEDEKKKIKKKQENGKKKNGSKKKDKENIPQDVSNKTQEIIALPEPPKQQDFFQKLLLRESNSPCPSVTSTTVSRTPSVLERAKKFSQPQSTCFKSEPSLRNLNVYLSQKRPVSESRFRSLERKSSRALSPFYGTYDFYDKLDKFDRHNNVWDYSLTYGPAYDSVKSRSSSEPPHTSPTFSQDACDNTESVSPSTSRSPSCRRIKRPTSRAIETISGVRRKFRSKSLNEADRQSHMGSTSSLSMSQFTDHDEYKTYFFELLHQTKKSDKFKELHKFYSSLERMAELEKTTSNTDLRPRLKGEEVIDFDRWKQLRNKEKAEKELTTLYEKLKDDQKEKGFLFQPKEPVRWSGDRGLRHKEKSVEDLRVQFQKLVENSQSEKKQEIDTSKDVYKPLWRGNSVANLASSLTSITGSKRGRPVKENNQSLIKPPVKKDKEIGSRLWSSLSMEQVNALKNQLTEIYSTVSNLKQERIQKMKQNIEDYEVNVTDLRGESPLHVRSNSLVAPDQLYSPAAKKKSSKRLECMKADSISTLPSWKSSSLSENDKRKLSMSLSAEVKERIKKKKHGTLVIPRETLGAVAAIKGTKKFKSPCNSETSPRTCYSLLSDDSFDKGEEKNKDFLLVLTPKDRASDVKKIVDDWGSKEHARLVPTTSSSSSSASTVIHLGYKDEFKASGSRISDLSQSHNDLRQEPETYRAERKTLYSSQSFTNLKDLFGEKNASTYATLPLRNIRKPCYSSTDSLYKSISPDPMKYYRAYLNVVKAGDVRKLREKFESYDDIYNLRKEQSPVRKMFQSDPDLARDFLSRKGGEFKKIVIKGQEVGDVQGLRRKYEPRKVISPIPFKVEDRYMPHINVISKTASLQRRALTPPSRVDVSKTGNVERLKDRFEKQGMSLLGQMYTSTPEITELRDIAPYLECEWVAHQNPRRSPSRRKIRPRPASASPVRQSILKQTDIFANQDFNPEIHRPLYRYQPEPWQSKPWARPTVTFKEPLGNPIPTPPRDGTSRQRIQESPHRYVESEVNIHYKSPVRREAKAAWPEDELAQRQAEIMRRIYQEQKRTKYLNELHDMYSRRHTDNLLPSQKSPIPLNRYDDFPVEVQPPRPRDRTPEPKLVARALYNFVGQTSRELSFRRGDIIYVRRQIDRNWYEGEHNAMIGLFPFNYVEIIPYDGIRTLPKKANEGQARAKFNFQAQTHLELSLVKGELVLLTRRVDENWFEGRIGNRKGIFPVSYVEVLVEPGERPETPSGGNAPSKPLVAPASHSVMLNGAKDLGQQHYQPPRPTIYSSSSLPPSSKIHDISLVNETLHIDTQSDPVPYRVMYNYRPQNEDELELKEGDIVYVMEKCDDGWYVGSLHRNGQFGTFPGNYVERIQ